MLGLRVQVYFFNKPYLDKQVMKTAYPLNKEKTVSDFISVRK